MADDHERLDEENEGGPVKSFLDHLEDLRWVLIKSLAALSISMLVCLAGGNYVVKILKRPLSHARVRYPGTNQVVTVRFGTHQLGIYPLNAEEQQSLALGTNRFIAIQLLPTTIGTNHVLTWVEDTSPGAAERLRRTHIELINLSPAGGFVVAFQVAFYGGLVLSGFFIFYFIAEFVFPALKVREKKYVYSGLIYGGGLFACGVAFCYFILLPVALSASQLYSEWLGFGASTWRAEDYISFVCKFMLGMGLGFELPVIILVLVKIGVLNYSVLSKARRYMIIVNLFLGAVLTTPEVITQVTMFVPLQLLYELSVWVAWYWEQENRSKARRRFALVAVIIAAIVALIWASFHYGWYHLNLR